MPKIEIIMTHSRRSNLTQGFSLVEMAIVLIIFGLFLSATLIPLSAQRDLSDYRTARADLEQIKEALYGYAIAKGKLPCPADSSGVAAASCSGSKGIQGNIPWVDLGVPRVDPWNQPYQYRVDQAFILPITLKTNFPPGTNSLIVKDSSSGNKIANGIPAVIYSSGKNGAIQPPTSSNDELENNSSPTSSKFDNIFVSHDPTTDFDDIVVWLSSSVLFNRMVSAQILPQ